MFGKKGTFVPYAIPEDQTSISASNSTASTTALHGDSGATSMSLVMRYLQLTNLLTIIFLAAACASLLAPFFPREAEKKGVSSSEYAVAFSSYSVVFGIVGPLSSKLARFVSHVKQVAYGSIIAGLSTVGLGILNLINGKDIFLSLVVLCRMAEAFGCGLAVACSPAIMALLFPDKMGRVMSMFQISISVGLLAGPPIGGVLYDVGGFGMPFFVLGSIFVLGGITTGFTMRTSARTKQAMSPDGSSSSRKAGFSKLVLDVGFLLDMMVMSINYSAGWFNQATLEPHLRQFSLSTIAISSVFMIMPCLILVISPIVGFILDRKRVSGLLTIVATALHFTSSVLVGPMPFFPINTQLWMVVVAQMCQGTAAATIALSCYLHAVENAVKRGFPNDNTTHSMVSGTRNVCVAVGGIVGPTLGGVLLEKLGYRMATVPLGGAHAFMFLALVLHTLTSGRNPEEADPPVRLTGYVVPAITS